MIKRKRVQLKFKKPSLTKQSFGDESNINKIMARYEKTGELPMPSGKEQQYGDFSEVSDYQEAMNKIMLAQNQFYELPAQLRKYFENDPENFVNFCTNPENKEKMQQMGLIPFDKIPEKSDNKVTKDDKQGKKDGHTDNVEIKDSTKTMENTN